MTRKCDRCKQDVPTLHPRGQWLCKPCLPKNDAYHTNRAKLEAQR